LGQSRLAVSAYISTVPVSLGTEDGNGLVTRRVATRYLAAKMRAPERPSFSVRTPQQNRNELGETTLNKTWRKHCGSPKNQNLEDIHCVVA